MTVKEIVAAVPVSRSTVTAHLNQLATVGVVIAEERDMPRLYRTMRSALEHPICRRPGRRWSAGSGGQLGPSAGRR